MFRPKLVCNIMKYICPATKRQRQDEVELTEYNLDYWIKTTLRFSFMCFYMQKTFMSCFWERKTTLIIMLCIFVCLDFISVFQFQMWDEKKWNWMVQRPIWISVSFNWLYYFPQLKIIFKLSICEKKRDNE